MTLLLRILLLIPLLLITFSCEQTNIEKKSQKKKVTTLRFGMNMGEGTAMYQAAVKLKETISERSNYTLKIELFPNQMLGSDQVMVEMARNGELDILLTPTAKLSDLVPAMQFFDIPFLLPERQDIYSLVDGELGDLLLSKLEPFGLTGVTFWENGFKQFTANTPLHKPADFKNKNFRIMKNQVILDQFRVLGANPIPIDFFRTYEALQDGAVDGQENPIAAIYHMKFYEQQKHLTLSNHAYLGYLLSISTKTLNKLSEEHKNLLIQTIKELTSYEREETAKREESMLTAIQNSEVKIYLLPLPEKHAFRTVLNGLKNKYWSIIGDDIMLIAEQYLTQKYGTPKEDSYKIGLNASMSGPEAISGQAILLGLQMAVDKINNSGGLLGKPIRIVQTDDMVIPARGKQNMEYLTHIENLIAVFGGKHTPVVLNTIDLSQKMKIPYLISWASGEAITDNGFEPNFVFRLSANDKDAARFIIKKAVEQANRIAFLGINSIWGKSNINIMASHLNNFGLVPTDSLIFNSSEDKFEDIVSKLVASDTEMVIYVGKAGELVNFIRAMHRMDANFKILSHWGITGSVFNDELIQLSENTDIKYIQTSSARVFNYKTFTDMVKTCSLCNWDFSKSNLLPATVHAYDLAGMLFEAVKLSGQTDGDSIRVALENMDSYKGLMATFYHPFNKNNHDALKESDYILRTLVK